MIGKPGKKLSATGGADAQSPIKQDEPLSHNADEVACGELGQQPYDETQSLREIQKSIVTIRDSEARFRATFENAAVGIARVALDGRFLEGQPEVVRHRRLHPRGTDDKDLRRHNTS